MIKTKILTWKCEDCNRVFETIYPTQMEQWKDAHMSAHKIRKKAQED